LIVRDGRVTGVAVRDLRRGTRQRLTARHVIVATGGFQSNLKMVVANWPPDLPKPARLLAGAAHSATGSGHELVRRAGGRVSRLDHQWNYVLGFPDPRDKGGIRGLAAFNFNAVWVNSEGKRFTAELGDERQGMPALLNQRGGTYWNVFDEKGKDGFSITVAGWENLTEVHRLVYDTPGVVLKAQTLDELAAAMRVPVANLKATVARYNELAAKGFDDDFKAFTEKRTPKPDSIEVPPFYAAQFFPITRKSMGGVDIDPECRVLDRAGRAIPGLYGVGEVTGFGGLNGKAALEGTFLGPSIYMGRIVARTITGQHAATVRHRSPPLSTTQAADATFDNAACVSCHNIAQDAARRRPGYWHFEQSHAKVLTRAYACSSCHAALFPYQAASHRLDTASMLTTCRACHGVQPRTGPPARP
jgi:succinate dehydrogenase/fumarate reductase flavoprotein subunit